MTQIWHATRKASNATANLACGRINKVPPKTKPNWSPTCNAKDEYDDQSDRNDETERNDNNNHHTNHDGLNDGGDVNDNDDTNL